MLWLVATVSLILPWIGVPLALWGGIALANGWDHGVLLVGTGIGLVVLDILIDFVWAASAVGDTDDHTLNRGGAMLIGRMGFVERPIETGRGQVRVGDTVWLAEGPDCPAGTEVVIEAVDGTVLKVATSPRNVSSA